MLNSSIECLSVDFSDLFKKNNKVVVVFTPNYTMLSGGVVALHGLAYDLKLLGVPVFLFCDSTAENSNVECIGIEKYTNLKNKYKVIGVYPEVFPNNPMNADYVVWWLLNKPNFFHKNWDGSLDWANRVLYFDWSFCENVLVHGSLVYPLYDTKIFYDKNVKRDLVLGYSHRITNHFEVVPFPEPKPDFVLKPEMNFNYEQLADLFNTAKFVYSYERSGTLWIAQLCGCPVFYISSPILNSVPEEEFGGGASVLDGDMSLLNDLKKKTIKVSSKTKEVWFSWERSLMSEVQIWLSS